MSEFPFDPLNSGHRNQWFCLVPGRGLCGSSRISPIFPHLLQELGCTPSLISRGSSEFGVLCVFIKES